jgi:hypothetical protein
VNGSFWLTTVAALVALSIFYGQALSPQRQERVELEQRMAKANAEFQRTYDKIKNAQALEQETARARVEADKQLHVTPEEQALLWIPEHVAKLFQKFGFANPVIRLNSAVKEPELRRYQRLNWSVVLPLEPEERDVTKALFGASELESSEPVIRVIDFATLPNQEKPGEQVVAVTLQVLVHE